MATVVKNINHLKKCAMVESSDFWIRLNYGAKSSKDIQYYKDDDSWSVFHSISGDFCEYKDDKDFIKNEDFIIEAINTNNLIWENNE